MQIELNGMYYILNLRTQDPGHGLIAEIVDEGFAFSPKRCAVTGLEGIAELIRAYTGLKPDRDLLHDLSTYLEDQLDAALQAVPHAIPAALPLQRSA